MSGPTLLARFLDAHGLTQAAFADQHGFSAPLLSMWLAAKRRPGLKAAFALEAATKGSVPASSWLERAHHRRVARLAS